MINFHLKNLVHIWKITISLTKRTPRGSMHVFFFLHVCFSLLLVNKHYLVNGHIFLWRRGGGLVFRFHTVPFVEGSLTISSNGSTPLNKTADMSIYGKNENT